jgi:hypothetical protein
MSTTGGCAAVPLGAADHAGRRAGQALSAVAGPGLRWPMTAAVDGSAMRAGMLGSPPATCLAPAGGPPVLRRCRREGAG